MADERNTYTPPPCPACGNRNPDNTISLGGINYWWYRCRACGKQYHDEGIH